MMNFSHFSSFLLASNPNNIIIPGGEKERVKKKDRRYHLKGFNKG
jgi:hypothetical protein